MPTKQQINADMVTLLAARWEVCRTNPLLFLEWVVFTVDQHKPDSPFAPFPAERPHIQNGVGLWRDNPLLVIVKSRQMVMTWTFCALALWDAMFNQGRLIMLQSKREADAIGKLLGDGD